jgi:putative acetyltransferase
MNYLIRRAEHADALGIIATHQNSIRELCHKDYSEMEIEAWAGRKFKETTWHGSMDRDYIWVVIFNGEVSGFCHFAVMDKIHGEVMGLYLRPELTGKGFAKKLFQLALEVAQKQHLESISLYSTLTAKGFYQGLGFQQSESDTSIDMQGVPISCIPMKMLI